MTVAVVTKPFSFEGKYRARNAEEGWQELQKYADTIITVPNDRLLSIMQKNSKLSDMLSMADNVLLQAVKGITDLINVPGLINADFADLRTVMKEVGPAVMGSGASTGEHRATEAARKAIDNQLLEDFGIDGARGLLINISASEESFTMAEFMEASALIQEKVDDDARVVIGALYDDALGDELHVTVIATGVGGMIDKKETINPVEDHMSRPAQTKAPEPTMKGTPAAPNKQPKVTQLPGSNFDALDNLGSSNTPEGQAANVLNWNDDYLETPTYLRKKAN